MSRPQSMPDFTALMDASMPIFEKRIHSRRQPSPERRPEHTRKKPSISLAAGLIMNADGPRTAGAAPAASPRKRSRDGPLDESPDEQHGTGSLFYAYALKTDYAHASPSLLTFASAAVCARWWTLVQRDYPESSRPSAQFFAVKGTDMDHIQDDPKFIELRHQWFCTSQEAPPVIPLQGVDGMPVTPSPPPAAHVSASPAADRLAEKLERLVDVVETNADQIHALSVAQSAGLQAMQEINESNSTQIKAIADSQIKLQALVDQNASHYIALSNTSFQSQEKIKEVMKSTANQIQSLVKKQAQLANTCDAMMRGLDSLSSSVEQMNLNVMSDTASSQSIASSASFGAMANRISPPPRKLNRKVKGVWYEYDNTTSTSTSTPTGSPRRTVNFVDTPPKSPVSLKKT